MIWYQSALPAIFRELKTSPDGLTKREAYRRLKVYGRNELRIKKDPLWKVIIEPFRSVFVMILLVAAAISLLTGERLDAVIIGAIISINAIIFYSQQYATTRVLRNLRRQRVGESRVLREGKQVLVPSVLLVPGDIVVISEGERIPADGRIISASELQIDESSLTGESVPVHKRVVTLETPKEIYEQDNMVFQGTYVLAGTAHAVVVASGRNTEFGKIAQLAAESETKSPVQVKIDQLITVLVKWVGILALVVFALSLLRGIPLDEAMRFVISLTVSAVPEGLPVALTVIIVLGMSRMAKKKALVRSFKAIEDVGLITTIATDKTGTLTKNQLSIVDNWSLNKDTTLLMQAVAKTIDHTSSQSDPLDQAIRDKTTLTGGGLTKLYPFDIDVRMSGAYRKKDSCIYIKGSPEHILAQSSLDAMARPQAESAMRMLAAKGYRVIAFGAYPVEGVPPTSLSDLPSGKLVFYGFLAFADELRPEAKRSIEAAQRAGISVRLITGDHYETAFNIGKTLGLAEHREQVVQGKELPVAEQALAIVIKDKTVFARILPQDKFKILRALKKTEITAMTGDGVNDVPALANAHVGIAMGSGSDIAKDAAGIVLLNDNFATIITAIAEGRKIFDNIRRMLFYLLSTSLGEVMTMVGALLVGLPLPVTPIQILWINIVTDTAMVLPLGLEPEEDGHMTRPPRHPRAPLLNRLLLSRMVLIALTMAIVTLTIVIVLQAQGYSVESIQTVAFMALIGGQWMNAFNARSEYKSSFSRLKKVNHGLIIGFIVAFTLQMIVMFGPLRGVFSVQSVAIEVLLIGTLGMAAAVLAVSELHKFALRKVDERSLR